MTPHRMHNRFETCSSRQPAMSVRAKRSGSVSRRVAGFTLVEVIIALALASLLFVAVYQALHLHWQYANAGGDDVARSQLLRAIASQFERDLRSVIYAQDPASADDAADTSATSSTGTSSTSGTSSSGTGTGGGTSGSSSTSGATTDASGSTTSSTTDPVDATAGSTTGLFGNANTLMFHVSKPSRDLSYSPLGDGLNAQSRTSDLLSITYFLSGTSGGSLSGALNGQTGLARLEGDRLSLTMADENGDTAALASGVRLLAAEVTNLQFEYFDGTAWLPEWDSAALRGLPRAVAIQFQLSVAQTSGSPRYNGQVATSSHRVVVAIPAAKVVVAY